jgi:hypothetical protein
MVTVMALDDDGVLGDPSLPSKRGHRDRQNRSRELSEPDGAYGLAFSM